jgi:hypothetical protein
MKKHEGCRTIQNIIVSITKNYAWNFNWFICFISYPVFSSGQVNLFSTETSKGRS